MNEKNKKIGKGNKREKSKKNEQDEIVDIPKTMEKYFRGGGKMVKPAPETVAQLVSEIPEGNITTLDNLRDKIAQTHKAHTSCPAATMKSLKTAINLSSDCCYWRVIKKDGQLIAQLPGGIGNQANKLIDEGIELDDSKKHLAVKKLEAILYRYD